MLKGKVAIVTGASRGIGKGIAVQLGVAGATVYITGRTMKPREGKPGMSLVEVAQEIEDASGVGIPVQCDHSNEDEIKAVFDRVRLEQNGRLDILVNNCYQGVEALSELMDKQFWEAEPDIFEIINNVGLKAHYVASVYAARMMVPRERGLIVNISSLGGQVYAGPPAYGVGKCAVDRMALDCGLELRRHNVAYVVVYPGPALTETCVELIAAIGKKMETDKSTVTKSESFRYNIFKKAETCEYIGKAVTHLAADPNVIKKSGNPYLTAELGVEYGFSDRNGDRPTNHRSLSGVLGGMGRTWLASLVPAFVPMPWWAIRLAMGLYYHENLK